MLSNQMGPLSEEIKRPEGAVCICPVQKSRLSHHHRQIYKTSVFYSQNNTHVMFKQAYMNGSEDRGFFILPFNIKYQDRHIFRACTF